MLEIDPDKITGFRIDDMENGDYYLSALTHNSEVILETGNFDSCHAKLNRIRNLLDTQYIDV